jgi:hypothetical protein
MKSIFSGKDMGFGQPRKTTRGVRVPQYFVFTEIELLSLIFCVMLDVIEYVAVVLTMPVVGDVFDVVGILVCFAMFRWIGLVSLVELVPGADVLPIFIITWLMWYFLRKQKIATHKL